MLTPVAPNFDEPLPLPDIPPLTINDPFERKATNMLESAIQAAHNAANTYIIHNSFQPFLDAVPFGISANFCESISSIVSKAGKAEFSFSWARTRPKPDTLSENPIIINYAQADIIGEAARNFRRTTPMPDTLVSGYISSLDKDKRDPLGNVVMQALIDGKMRPVKLALSDEDYKTAYAAHSGYKTVAAEGVLVQRGNQRVLENITRFIIELNE